MRMRTSWLRFTFVLSLVLATDVSVDAAPPDPVFLAAKQTFLKDMKKKDPAMRAAAVTAMARFAQKETVEILLKRGLIDDNSTVREALRHGLQQLASERAVVHEMLDELRKSFRKSSEHETTAIELLRALASTSDESIQSELVKLLDDLPVSVRGNLLIPMALIDDFGVQGDVEAERSVELLAKVHSFENHFGYRRCVVQAMSRIRQPDAVGFLIELLPKTSGLIQADVVEYLTRLTGQKFKDHDRNWAKWWKENRDDFKFLPTGKELPEAKMDETQQNYYGIPICAKRIVFVLDTSGSMRGAPMEAAKQALLKTIESLPESVAFDVVFFDVTATTWLPRLVPASRQAKEQASRLIVERGLGPGTVSSSALNAAFDLEPEAIYFLSDGEPTDGSPPQIVGYFSDFNRTRRVSIHTIGVVTQRNGGAGLTSFMQPLSDKNYGKFRLVE